MTVRRAGEVPRKSVVLTDEEVPTERLSWKHLGFEVNDAEVNGILISKVRPESPAEAARLLPGDVVEGLGPWVITNSDDLLRFLQIVQADDIIEVRIKRLERVAGRVLLARLHGTMQAQ